MYNFTDRLNKIYKIYHQSPSITEKCVCRPVSSLEKKQQLRIPKYNAKYNKCHQYNSPHNYKDTLNRSAFLSKYRKHQRQARWIQRRMPIRKVGVRSLITPDLSKMFQSDMKIQTQSKNCFEFNLGVEKPANSSIQ